MSFSLPDCPRVVMLDAATLPQALPALTVAHEWVARPLTAAADVVTALQGATVAITNKVPITADMLAALPDLRLIAVAATGTNHVDVAACVARGVAVCNVPAYSTKGVAEHALMLMLALRRGLLPAHRASTEGEWAASPIFCLHMQAIQDLAGQTLGILGGGAIGQRLAHLAQALDMQVLWLERAGASVCRPGRVPLLEGLPQLDVLSVHCPLTPETRGVIGAAELARMKPSALVINTARGGVVDEEALLQALQAGRLAGAGLDVLSTEPPPAQHPLLQGAGLNLIVTPHVAWSSADALQGLGRTLIQNIETFLRGGVLNRVDLHHG